MYHKHMFSSSTINVHFKGKMLHKSFFYPFAGLFFPSGSSDETIKKREELAKKVEKYQYKWEDVSGDKKEAHLEVIGVSESLKCDVNPQPNTQGIGPLVGRTSGNHRSVMHVLAVILSIACHFFFICEYIFIRVIWSGSEICPLLIYPSIFLTF